MLLFKLSLDGNLQEVFTNYGAAEDELEKYLKKEVKGIKDILSWWKDNQEIFPNLARMARGYLAIPGTSVSVEWLFSQAGDIATPNRSSLDEESLGNTLELKSWLAFGGRNLFDHIVKEMLNS